MENLHISQDRINYKSNPARIFEYLINHSQLLEMRVEDCRSYLQQLLNERLEIVSKTVPYYKDIVKSNLIGSLIDSQFLTKQDLRKNIEKLSFKISSKNDIVERESSGSAGVPIQIRKTVKLFDFYSALSVHELIHHGWTPLDVYFVLHGSGIGNLDPGINPSKLIEVLLDSKPDIISCYPSYLLNLISLDYGKNKLKDLRLKFIATHSEQSSSSERELIEKFFNCPVYDEYGSTETGPIAIQCENKKYHILEDNVYVEIIGVDGKPVDPGELGEIVVTDLRNDSMALIRYKLGDLGSIGDYGTCGCSWNNFRLLTSLEGRKEDSFILPSGRVIPSGQMISKISVTEVTAIKEWQVVQEDFDKFTVYIVEGSNYNSKVSSDLVNSLAKVFSESVQIRVKYKNQINKPTEKRRVYRSHVYNPND